VGTRYCKGCQAVVTGAWWCPGCKAARGQKPTSSRYGGEHQRKRASEREAAYGTACCRCGRPMLKPQEIHLDHDERGGYLGWSHSGCNLSAGGRKGRAIQTGRLVVNGHAAREPITTTIEVPAPLEQCTECGRTTCRRPTGLVSRCW
jgi:hypothetical protein